MPSKDVGGNEQQGEEQHRVAVRIDSGVGDVVGRDKVMGDVVYGDKVMGDKHEVTFIQKIFNFLQGDTEQQRAFRNRQNMLQLVWNTWIEGVLKKSLYNEVLIELGMETKPDAIEHPWDTVIQMPDRAPRMVVPGMTMLELFDQSNGALLILGEPGSGKTTMLLELARQAIERAQADPLQPIPVVFNLSSWTPKLSIADWLVEEIRGKYSISPKIGRTWVDNDELLLLLDGLDEVKAESRETCVLAVNAFQEIHALPWVVCSRLNEYTDLGSQLKQHGAVLIQPLTRLQVDDYLQSAGFGLAALGQTLQCDPELYEFAQTPLILNIMVLAYQNAAEEELRALEKDISYRKQLFDAYIGRMFKRRSSVYLYPEEQTRSLLVWLAHAMVGHEQVPFYIENIQFSWLPFSPMKRILLGVLSFGLTFGLIGASIGSAIGSLKGDSRGALSGALLYGLTGLLIFGLLFGLRGDFKPTEKLQWSWSVGKRGLINGIVVGLIVGFFTGMIYGLDFGLIDGLIFGLVFGLLFGVLPGVIIGLGSGLRGSVVENRNLPGEGIKTSLKNFMFAGLVAGLIFALVVGLTFSIGFDLSNWLNNGLNGALSGGLFFGLIFGMHHGGAFIFTHYLTRLILYRSHQFPWNIVAFLNYCTDRIFLHRVGGGYIFIHRMLMEHFAAMGTDEARSKAADSPAPIE